MSKPFMVLCETNNAYRATVNNITVTILKDIIEIKNGIRQHPRMVAIEEAAKQAQITEWILFNVKED